MTMISRNSPSFSLKSVNPETVEFINQLIHKNTHSKTKKVMNLVYSVMFGLIASKYLPTKYPKMVMAALALLMYVVGRKIGGKYEGGEEEGEEGEKGGD